MVHLRKHAAVHQSRDCRPLSNPFNQLSRRSRRGLAIVDSPERLFCRKVCRYHPLHALSSEFLLRVTYDLRDPRNPRNPHDRGASTNTTTNPPPDLQGVREI